MGEIGTVYFADAPVFTYHNDPEKTKKAYNEKGWSTLGDVGYLDAEGFLYLTDRKSYMIISGGVNIYPQETEDVLITHPAVSDVAVFGVPNEEMGEEVKAVVQPHDMAKAGKELEAELIVFCRKHLSPIKCPKSIDFEAGIAAHADRQAGEAASARQILAEAGGEGVARDLCEDATLPTLHPPMMASKAALRPGEVRKADEGSLSAETDPSPVSNELTLIRSDELTLSHKGRGEERRKQ